MNAPRTRVCPRIPSRVPARGFTLMEIMVTVALVAILASVALPSYAAYVKRARVPPALVALSSYSLKMEQVYQDSGSYGADSCPAKVIDTPDFHMSCTPGKKGRSYVATVTGSGQMEGYSYTIDQDGNRATVAHPKGGNRNCWTSKGGSSCDL
jgi:type IV pilus assembly protein PilE